MFVCLSLCSALVGSQAMLFSESRLGEAKLCGTRHARARRGMPDLAPERQPTAVNKLYRVFSSALHYPKNEAHVRRADQAACARRRCVSVEGSARRAEAAYASGAAGGLVKNPRPAPIAAPP